MADGQARERDFTIPEALDMGAQFAMAGNHKSATTMFRGVLVHEPENFEAIERLGSSLFELQQYHEALYWFWRGRKLDRRHPLSLTNYGLCVSQLGHCEEALPDLERAVARAEKDPGVSPAVKALVCNNLGNTLLKLDRFADALAMLERGIRHDPEDPFPHYNRGIALIRLNRHREGLEALDLSLKLRPPALDSASRLNAADATYNRGMAHLLLGNLAQGFADYEARHLTSENKTPNLGLPAERKWDGSREAITGKRILVHAEQGLGDEIQFLRFVPLLATYDPAEIVMVSHKAVAPFASAIPGVRLLHPGDGGNFGDLYDVWVALMSLPHFLGIKSEEMIPAPLLPAISEHRIAHWRRDLALPSDKLNVGVCFAGQFQHRNNHHRSIPLLTFAALFGALGCNFISVQQMCAADAATFPEIAKRHQNVTAVYLDDLRDTAAVFANLDLVVSVDTAVAHLAASMGKETWILIPKFGCDWRWMLDRADSPWYPAAQLIRQKSIGDWASTLKDVKALLERKATRRQGARAA